MISFCIFIASNIISASPALKLILLILPGIGAATVVAPAGAAFLGAGAAAGAAAGASSASGAASVAAATAATSSSAGAATSSTTGAGAASFFSSFFLVGSTMYSTCIMPHNTIRTINTIVMLISDTSQGLVVVASPILYTSKYFVQSICTLNIVIITEILKKR